jgi:plastocyanin
VEYVRVEPASAGSVSGKMRFTGRKPVRRVIDMAGEEVECKRLHPGPVFAEGAVINPDSTLANVFVHVSRGFEGRQFEPAAAPARFDQKGCRFAPHVLGVRAGQPVVVSNSDPVTHNVHPMPKLNREWNQGQPPGSPNIERVFREPEVGIPVKCNVHSWMRAYICVTATPYFAVTGSDGAFEMKGLPPGEYTIAAWHEKFGTQEQKISLAASQQATLDFTWKSE